MARQKTTTVGGLNIRIHPHSRDRYVSLIYDAFSLKRPIHYRGDQFLLLSEVGPESRSPIEGSIARYTELETDGAWFNTRKFDEADPAELRQIKIPPELKPNYHSFWFLFFPEVHTLVFQLKAGTQSLSPQGLQTFFENLFSAPDLVSKYGPIAVNTIADKDQLQHILGLAHLRKLTLVIERPNPGDIGEDMEREIERRLIQQNAKRLEESYTAVPGASLKPDEHTKKYCDVAMHNGIVVAEGQDANGVPDKRSSKNHPAIKRGKYDPDLESARDSFIRVASSFIEQIRRLV